jgi:hypothetical protein
VTDERREVSQDSKFHDEAVTINAIMQTDGWKAFLARIERRRKALAAKMARCETDLEVSAVEKKGDNITVVVLLKDPLKMEEFFWKNLEGEFEALKAEAAKIPGGTND